MRKHFLILMLFALLPLAGFAANIEGLWTVIAPSIPYGTSADAHVTVKEGVDVDVDDAKYSVTYYTDNNGQLGTPFAAATLNTQNVGNYWVKVTAISGGYEGEIIASFKINPASLVEGDTRDYTSPKPVVSALEYSGTAQNLITAGAIVTTGGTGSAEKCGTFTYALGKKVNNEWTDEGCTYAAALPQGTNAGEYKIYWKLSGSLNYAEAKGSVVKSIDAKDLDAYDAAKYTFTVSPTANYTYTGVAQTGLPTISVKSGTTPLTAGADYEVVWYKKVGTAAISYTAENKQAPTYASYRGGNIVYYAQVEGKGNYKGAIKHDTDEDATKIWKMTVTKKSLMTYVQPITKIYDGVRIVTTGTVAGEDVNITGAEVVATGLVEGDDYLKDQLYAQFSRGTETTEAIPDLTLNAWNTTETAPVNYRKNGYPMVAHVVYPATPEEGQYYIDDNYEINFMNVGVLTISQRELKVTAKKQTAQYTGEALNINDVIKLTGADQTVIVANADETTGIVGTEDVTGLMQIALKVVLDEDQNPIPYIETQNYPAAIQITASAAQANSNYKITATPGDFEITGKPLKLIARTFSKEYGYVLAADVKDWLTDDPTVTKLAANPVFVVKNADGDEVEGLLPRGTYTITISNFAELAPENYTIAAADVFPGTLTITQKTLDITVNPLTVNAGVYESVLGSSTTPGYASVQEFTTVNNEQISYYFEFGTGVTKDGDPLRLTSAANAVPYSHGVTVKLITDTDDDNYEEANANYKLSVTDGALTVVDAGALILAQADPNLDAKINAAKNTEKAVTFDSRVLKANTWYTMVLPFTVKTTELVASLKAVDDPEEATPTYHPVYAIVNRLNASTTAGSINFTLEMMEIPENEPFLIKVAENVNMKDATFGTKTIKYKADPSITYGGEKLVGVYTATPLANAENEWYGFLGNRDMKGSKGNPLDNTWYNARLDGLVINPMEAYLQYGEAHAPRITIEDYDFETGTTAIKTLNVETMKAYSVDGWYTLNGVKLQGVPTEKGIYINNGKKVVIK